MTRLINIYDSRLQPKDKICINCAGTDISNLAFSAHSDDNV